MDNQDYTTEATQRKRGQHFTLEERCEIQSLKRNGKSLRQIAAAIGCSHNAVFYELKRNTPKRTGKAGRTPQYNAAKAQKAYEARRKRCRKKGKATSQKIEPFIQWAARKVKEENWSLDVCCGFAKKNALFPPDGMACTKTLYNMLHNRLLPLSLFDVPRALSWRRKPRLNRKHKYLRGRSIEERPEIINRRGETGHWEADTVIGKKGKGNVILTLTERQTKMAITLKISSKSRDGVAEGVEELLEEYGEEHFSEIFKSVTCDNGTEFAGFSDVIGKHGTSVYFAHPYSSFERGQNEKFNSQLRKFVPKGKSIDAYSAEEIMSFGDIINSTPRRILGYETPESLFNEFLDTVYAL